MLDLIADAARTQWSVCDVDLFSFGGREGAATELVLEVGQDVFLLLLDFCLGFLHVVFEIIIVVFFQFLLFVDFLCDFLLVFDG